MASTRLSYPEDIGSALDYMKIEFGKYEAPYGGLDPNKNPATIPPSKGTTYYSPNVSFSPSDELYLNMPSDIGSNFGGQWGGKDVTALAGFGLKNIAAPISQAVSGKTTQAAATIKNWFTGTTITNAATALAEDALKELGNQFANLPGLGSNLTANDVLALTSGTIINPNTELLYGGAGLRSHGYSFKMIPQTKNEAQNVIKIVDRFKRACAPKKNSVSLFGQQVTNFLGLPDIVQVKFMNASGENIYLPRYKPSAITSVSVDYITEGQYVGMRDGEPIGVSLTIALTELKMIFSEEIGSGATNYR